MATDREVGRWQRLVIVWFVAFVVVVFIDRGCCGIGIPKHGVDIKIEPPTLCDITSEGDRFVSRLQSLCSRFLTGVDVGYLDVILETPFCSVLITVHVAISLWTSHFKVIVDVEDTRTKVELPDLETDFRWEEGKQVECRVSLGTGWWYDQGALDNCSGRGDDEKWLGS
jgi:hypothetical protein